MKAIKFVQWSSSIAIVLIVLWILVIATMAILVKDDPTIVIAGIVKIGGLLAIFVTPEKVAAFFGPVLKRKQENGGGG